MSIVLYLATFFAVMLFVILKIKKDGFLSLFSVVIITISILYLLAPALTFIFGNYSENHRYFVSFIYRSTESDRFKAYLIIALTLALFLFSDRFRLVFGKRNHSLNISASEKRLPYRYSEEDKNSLDKLCFNWFIVLFVLGIIGYVLVISQVGFLNLILKAGAARGVSGSIGGAGSLLAYAKILAKLLIASLAPGIMLLEIRKSKMMYIIIFIVFGLSLMLEIFMAGKSNTIIFILPFFIYFLNKRGSIKTSTIVLIGIVAIALVIGLENLFYYLQNGVSVSKYRTSWVFGNYVMRYVYEFTYPYCNLLFSSDMISQNGYRFFVDYLAAIVNLIPAILLGGFQIKPFYQLTTKFYQTYYPYMVDGVPNDYIYCCLGQLGIPGLVLITVVWSQIIIRIDEHISNLRYKCSVLNINPYHLLSCCCFFGIVTTLIEPYSAISTQPILTCSVIMCIQFDRKLKAGYD